MGDDRGHATITRPRRGIARGGVRLRLTTSTALLLLVLMLLPDLTAAIADPPDDTAGDHHGSVRFTTHGAGFPPQPAGLAAARPVDVTAFAGTGAGARSRDDHAVMIVRRDPRVRQLVDGRAELLGVEVLGAKSARPGARVVAFYVYDEDVTVSAVVDDGSVADVHQTPAARWQPPLTAAEVQRAVDLARDQWREDGHQDVDDLRGFALLAGRPGGGWNASRIAYVSFHAHIDARPELVSWVDLSDGVVVRGRTETPGSSPAGPSHFEQQPVSTEVPRSGQVDWQGWSFRYDVSGRMDGVSLEDVTLDGVAIMARASLPAITVFYDDDDCGPFVDRLGGRLTPVEWAGDAEVVLREFVLDEEPWLEVGVLDTLGDYVLYQVFYLSGDGRLDAHTFAKGLQCNTDHVHYPFWRFDIDLAGAGGDRIIRQTVDGPVTEPVEFSADAGVAHGWQVRDIATGHRLDVSFDDSSWNVPGEVIPETSWNGNRIYGRRFLPAEAGTWGWPATDELPGDQDEPLDGQDLVLWYRGNLPHTTAEGPALWHSTGVHLTVTLSPRHFVRTG